MEPFEKLTPTGKARRQRDNLRHQLDAVDGALPVWNGTGRGRVQTIDDLRARVARLEAANGRLTAALERHFPEDLAHRADGLKMCKYCSALVSLGPHKVDCPRAALSDGGEGWPLTEADKEAIREGVKAMKEGRVRPWKDVERELFGEGLEVREQVRRELKEAKCEIVNSQKERHGPGQLRAAKRHIDAALAALEGK